MYDLGKVIPALAIFLALMTFPVWYNLAGSGSQRALTLDTGSDAQACVESRQFMRASHMDLLNRWRSRVVREEERIYRASDGKRYVMSLSNTCLGCHQDKAQFCDKCHNYMGVSVVCWDCHLEPKETEQWVSIEGSSAR